MKKTLEFLGYGFAVLLLLLVGGPFLVPVPALENLKPAKELADPDSRFIEVKGLTVHYKQAEGMQSDGSALLLLHGFAANTFSWREVLAPLAAQASTVIAFDRPGFGLTERVIDPQPADGPNPYTPEFQAELNVALMDALGIDQAVFIGNSAGGTSAVFITLNYPERVQALVLVDAAIYTGGGAPDWIKPLLRTPQMRRLGPLVSRSLLGRADQFLELAWHDPSRIEPGMVEGYTKTSQVQDWDKALWEFTLASRDLHLGERLAELDLPVLVITGDDDRIVPTEQSLRLAQEIPGAELEVIANCGHVPQEECPAEFLAVVKAFLERRVYGVSSR